jgi:hypothetical protein
MEEFAMLGCAAVKACLLARFLSWGIISALNE